MDKHSSGKCTCTQYKDLELTRDAISKRIKETKKIVHTLRLNVTNNNGTDKFYQCPQCGQNWQESNAWNWGSKNYVFKVPKLSLEEWQKELYVRPDQLLLYDALMHRFTEGKQFKNTNSHCQMKDCSDYAIEMSVVCLKHHIEMLQNIGNLPKEPTGRWFLPYRKILSMVFRSDS